MILGLALLLGLAVTWGLGARISRLGELRLRGGGLVLASLAIQLTIFTRMSHALPSAAQRPLHMLSYALLVVFLLLNLRQPGFWLAGLGLLLNLTVIYANGGRMPVSLAAWQGSGRDPAQILRTGVHHNNILAGPHAIFPWLGDVFALPKGLPLSNMLSIGDLLLVLGMTLFLYRTCEGAARSRLREVLAPLRSPPFRRLLGGRASSRVADWLTTVAVVSWLFTKTGSAAGVSAFLIARILAATVGGVLAAPLLDRLPQARTLSAVEGLRAALILVAIPLALHGWLVPVAALVCISNLLSAATRAAAPALVADLLPEGLVNAGNALHGIARTAVMMLGSLAGGLAFAHFGIAGALAAGVAAFAAAAFSYSGFSLVAGPPPEPGPSLGRLELAKAIAGNRPVLGLTVSFTIVTAAMGLLNASLPAFFHMRFGGHNAYGYAMAAIGAGLLCGEFMTSFVREHSVARRSVGLAFAASAGAVLLLARSPVEATAFLMLFALGASDGTTEVVYDTLFQAHLPRRMRAGVFALASSIQNGGMIVGLALSPILLAVGSPRAALDAVAVGCLAGAAIVSALLLRAPPSRAPAPGAIQPH